MKSCPNCGFELRDDAKFCDRCGAQCESTDKKPNYFERRRAKERETQEILDKSYIHTEEIDHIESLDLSALTFKKRGTVKQRLAFTLTITIVCGLLIIGAMTGVYFIRTVSGHDNLKLLALLAMFIISAAALAIVVERSYYLRVLHSMKSSRFAVKKVIYAQPPQMCYDGVVYSVNLNTTCPACMRDEAHTENRLHVEEVEGTMIAVCGDNRSHLFKIDTVAIKACFDPETCKLDEQKLSDYLQQHEEVSDQSQAACEDPVKPCQCPSETTPESAPPTPPEVKTE